MQRASARREARRVGRLHACLLRVAHELPERALVARVASRLDEAATAARQRGADLHEAVGVQEALVGDDLAVRHLGRLEEGHHVATRDVADRAASGRVEG